MFFRKISSKVLRSKEQKSESRYSDKISNLKISESNDEDMFEKNSSSMTVTDMYSSSAGKLTAFTESSSSAPESSHVSAIATDECNVQSSPFMRRINDQEHARGLHMAFTKTIDDDRSCDITLLGRDNAKVPAVKSILARCTKVLKKKLNEHQTETYVDFGEYGEHALRAMKDYCHTGDISLSLLCRQRSAMAAEQLAELAILSEAYDLNELYGKADHILCQLINTAPWFATAAYEVLGVGAKPLEDYVFYFIQGKCPDLFMETSALKYLSHSRLSAFLDRTDFDETYKLRFSMKWLKEKGHTAENISSVRRIASESLCLKSLLQDSLIVFEVTSSGLFDMCDIDTIINGEHVSHSNEESPKLLVAHSRNERTIIAKTDSFDSQYNVAESLQVQSLALAKEQKKKKKKKKEKKKKERRKELKDSICYQLSLNGDVCTLPLDTEQVTKK